MAACSSTKHEPISKADQMRLGDVSTVGVGECQISCFQRAHNGLRQSATDFDLYNPKQVDRFVLEIQSCNFGCFKQRTEMDDLTDRLYNEAKR
jgi:hypothetical protein